MASSRCFVCLYSSPTPHDASQASSFTKDISETNIIRSPVLQQAVNTCESDEEEPKLMLPLGAGDDFLDSWLQFTCASRDENGQLPQKRGASSEFIVRTLQAADFLADEHAMAQACQDLSIRMFGHVKGVGAPASKKRKTNKSRASMAHKLIQERRDANEKMLQQLTPNVYLQLFHSVNPTAHLLECVRYLHPQHHTLLLEAQFRDGLLACRLELPDMAQEADDYIEEISDVLTATATLTHLTSLSITSDEWVSDCSPAIQESLLALLTSLPSLQGLVLAADTAAALESLGTAVLHTNLSSLHTLVLMAPADGCETQPFSTRQQVTVSAEDATAVVHKLQGLPGLRNLACSKVKESCEDIAPFCAALRALTALTSLALERCFVSRGWLEARGRGTEVTGHVAGALKKLRKLEALSLDQSFPTTGAVHVTPGECIEPVLDAIGYLTALTFLSLSELNYREHHAWMQGEEVPDDIEIGHGLAPTLCQLKRLKHLNLTKYYIAHDVAESVVDAIVSMAALTALYLTEVADDEDATLWEMFAPKVSGLRQLRDLCVSKNDALGVTIGDLAEGLAELPHLRWLGINRCEIERDGVVELAKHLPSMTALQHLFLQDNRLSPDGAKALAATFPSMTQLQRLALYKGDIGVAGQEALLAAAEASLGCGWREVLDITVDWEDWESEGSHGEDPWADMEAAEIQQLLLLAEHAAEVGVGLEDVD